MQPVSILDIVTNSFFKLGKFSPSESIPSEDSAYALMELQGMVDAWNADELFIYATDYLEYILIPSIQPLLIGEGVAVTSVSATGGQATYVGKNHYATGDLVSTGNIGTIGGLNFNQLTVPVINATPTQFVLNIAAGTVASTPVLAGQAIYATDDNIFPNYMTLATRPVKIADANIILNNVTPIVKVPLVVHNGKQGKDWWIANTVPNVPSTIPTDLYYNPRYPNGEIYLWPEQTVNYGLELEV